MTNSSRRNESQVNTFSTMNRKLEQVLYNHGIMFIGQHKNIDGMTVWTYEATQEVEEIVRRWREAQERNRFKLSYQRPTGKE